MATLHIINSAPSDSAALGRCLRCASDGDTVLFIGNGVYCGNATAFERLTALARDVAWLTLADDVTARGLADRLHQRIGQVDDAGFVDLVVTHQPIVSWSE